MLTFECTAPESIKGSFDLSKYNFDGPDGDKKLETAAKKAKKKNKKKEKKNQEDAEREKSERV